MLSLNLPTYPVKVTYKAGKQLIFDPVRLKYVALTPEEWVRQHFVNYLVTEKGFPKELIANEVCLKLNGMSRRCDTIVYDCFLTSLVILEYKSHTVEITKAVFDQIARYNMVLRVQYLIVSNGIRHFCCKIDYETQKYSFLQAIPEYTHISSGNDRPD